MLKEGNRGQVSIFIVIALLIVAGIGGYFAVRSQVDSGNEAGDFSEVFSYYQECIERYTVTGLSIASSQGGRIENEGFIPGSSYSPFGSHLVVSGVPVEYWSSIGNNGLLEKNVPARQDVEGELATYISSRLGDCDFESFRERGLDVSLSQGNVETRIAADGVFVNVDSALTVGNANSSALREDFSIEVESNFGQLYQDALEVYNKEQSFLFLENYSFDVLRLYAPVDGVEIQCSPKVWPVQDVFTDLRQALDANVESINMQRRAQNSYFDVSVDVENDVDLLYDPQWPSRFEVYGNKGNLLVAEPVGNQQGLQALGFCYVPYHFVYDLYFPVLVRVSSEREFFQFPVVVVIDKNTPREAGKGVVGSIETTNDLCAAATQDVSVIVRGDGGQIPNSTVSYSCFDQSCPIGMTNNNGIAGGKIPACLNGFLEVEAEGYRGIKELFSSHNSSEAEIRLEKEYDVEVLLKVDGRLSNALSFISLQGENGIKHAVIPDSPIISLSSGFYNLTVYQYGNTSIRIPASTTRQCIEVSAGGLSGLLGSTKEECFNIEIPETVIDRALTAGGQGEVFLPKELLESGELTIMVNSLPKPTGIGSLTTNYALFETQGADVEYG